ncbi:SseB family protein [Streptomyces sp. NPDC090306]|uniref:SseB family protein n=1 Tax=Streptomyces sp. NPDC090306 TaxID=3365961 RepID=UPI00380D4E1C
MYGYGQTMDGGGQQQYAGGQQMPGQQMPGADGYGRQQQHQQHYPEPSPPSLAEAVRAFTSGQVQAEDFQQVFASSKVYCPRGDNPGFLALHNTQQPVIPMFTSLKELRRYAGKESKYFVITGAEVIDLLPTGYGFVLDMEGEHRIVFDAKSVEQMVDFAMRRMYG